MWPFCLLSSDPFIFQLQYLPVLSCSALFCSVASHLTFPPFCVCVSCHIGSTCNLQIPADKRLQKKNPRSVLVSSLLMNVSTDQSCFVLPLTVCVMSSLATESQASPGILLTVHSRDSLQVMGQHASNPPEVLLLLLIVLWLLLLHLLCCIVPVMLQSPVAVSPVVYWLHSHGW